MHNRQWDETFRANGVCQSFSQFFYSLLFLSSFPSLSLPCMPQMFFLVAPTDRNLLARRKARSSPGEKSTKPPVCAQQMQKASPSATNSMCHMGLRDLVQEDFFFFFTSAYISFLPYTQHQMQTHIQIWQRYNSKIKFTLTDTHMCTHTGIHSIRLQGVQELLCFKREAPRATMTDLFRKRCSP